MCHSFIFIFGTSGWLGLVLSLSVAHREVSSCNFTVLRKKELISFDLFIYRAEPGKTGRGHFGGSIRARFSCEIVGILRPGSPRPAGQDV